MGPRTGLDEAEKRKARPYRDSNSDPSAIQSVVSRFTDCAILATPQVYFTYQHATQMYQTVTRILFVEV
jgi:hypothetical protein